jgi:hypothetical protein
LAVEVPAEITATDRVWSRWRRHVRQGHRPRSSSLRSRSP